jgi:Ca-activated chloride channel homolog
MNYFLYSLKLSSGVYNIMIHIKFLWILLLLPLPFVIFYVDKKDKPIREPALKIPFYDKLNFSTPLIYSVKRIKSFEFYFLFFIWILLLMSAARPELWGQPISMKQEGRNILLAVDLSGSMKTEDMLLNAQKVDRLTAIKSVAEPFIQGRAGDRVGLIVFGSQAYLETPLTFDLTTVVHILNDNTVGLAGQTTAIGDAIGLAIKRLKAYPPKSRILILLTDGANNSGVLSPLQAAELAKKNNVKIYTIGFGSDEMIVSTLIGDYRVNPSADLDEETLNQIAKITGGDFFRAKNTFALQSIYSAINRLEPVQGKNNIYHPVKDIYYLPLGIALLLIFLYSFFRALKVFIHHHYRMRQRNHHAMD